MLRLWTHPQTQSARLYFTIPAIRKATKAVKGDWNVKDVKLWLESSDNGQAEIFTVIKGYDSIPESTLDQFQSAAMDVIGIDGKEAWDELVNLAVLSENKEQEMKRAEAEKESVKQHEINAGAPAANAKRFHESMGLDIASINISEPITVQIDSKETKLIENLIKSHPKITVERSQLDLADFRIQDNDGNELLIERKRCTGDGHKTDFEAGIQNESCLFERSEKLSFISANSDHQIIPIVILEGNVYGNAGTLLIHQIDSAISFLSAVNRISVLSTYSATHSAFVIVKLASNFAGGHISPIAGIRKKPKALYEQKKHVLESIPGISAVIADSLLERFKSVKGVAIANEEELASVRGIGFKRAKEITRVLGAF